MELTHGYKLDYIRKNNARNGVGIVVYKDLQEKNCSYYKEVG